MAALVLRLRCYPIVLNPCDRVCTYTEDKRGCSIWRVFDLPPTMLRHTSDPENRRTIARTYQLYDCTTYGTIPQAIEWIENMAYMAYMEYGSERASE